MLPAQTHRTHLLILRNLAATNCVNHRGKCKKPIPEVGKTTYVYKNLPEYPHPSEEFEKDEFLPRRLSYWPSGIPQLRVRPKLKPWSYVKEYLTLYPPEEPNLPEYTDEPQYPPITDYRVWNMSLSEKQNRRVWYDKIKELPTFDQKMFEISNIKAHPTVTLKAWSHVYNNLPLYQQLTRTSLVKNQLPDSYASIAVVDQDRNDIRDQVLDAIRLHIHDAKEKRHGSERKRRRTSNWFFPNPLGNLNVENLIEEVANICVKSLSGTSRHLLDAQYDYSPDVLSWWYTGNLPVPSSHPRYSYRKMKTVDQMIQYQDMPILNIRCRDPLTSDAPFEKHSVGERAEYNYHPRQCGYALKWCFPAMLPGFWPEHQEHGFPLLSFYSRDAINNRHSVNELLNDVDEAVDGIGLMSSFAWCNAVAANHGFTPYQELTYPFTTQTVVTDGQTWTFFVYQLNRHSFHSDLEEPSCDNICWSSGPMKLFENFENDTFNGINDQVVDTLIKFFLRKPVPLSSDIQLRPYIGEDTRTEEEAKEMRFKLARRFGQRYKLREKWWLRAAYVPAYEHIYLRPSYAPPTVHWRKMFRYPNKLRTNRNQFTV